MINSTSNIFPSNVTDYDYLYFVMKLHNLLLLLLVTVCRRSWVWCQVQGLQLYCTHTYICCTALPRLRFESGVGGSSYSSWWLFRSERSSGWWQLAAAAAWKEGKTKHSALRGCAWLMAEVCVAPGTLGAATDQSSCKTNLTLAEPPPHLLPPEPLYPHRPPSPPSHPRPLAAKRTRHDGVPINHPKQSMFNLWHAGLTRKFITCCS